MRKTISQETVRYFVLLMVIGMMGIGLSNPLPAYAQSEDKTEEQAEESDAKTEGEEAEKSEDVDEDTDAAEAEMGEEEAASEMSEEPGLLITAVSPTSPAAEAGLVRGNILLQINGNAVNSRMDLVEMLGTMSAGDEIILTVQHGDDERELTATLGERDGNPFLGIVTYDADFRRFGPRMERFEGRGQLPFRFDFDPEAVMPQEMTLGAHIVEVMPDSPAAEAGLQEGDVIISLNGQPLEQGEHLGNLIMELSPNETIMLEIRHHEVRHRESSKSSKREDKESHTDSDMEGHESESVTVVLGEHPDDPELAYLGIRYHTLPDFMDFGMERFRLDRHGNRHFNPDHHGERGFGHGRRGERDENFHEEHRRHFFRDHSERFERHAPNFLERILRFFFGFMGFGESFPDRMHGFFFDEQDEFDFEFHEECRGPECMEEFEFEFIEECEGPECAEGNLL